MPGTPYKLFAAGAALALGAVLGLEALERPVAPRRELVVLATGEVRARVRRCGCMGDAHPEASLSKVSACACHTRTNLTGEPGAADLGAFPERSSFQRAVGGDPLVVDSGDLLFPSLDPRDEERDEWMLRARLLVDLEARLDLAAFTPGELDLALGRKALEELAARAKFAVLAGNLADARTHAPIFPGHASFLRSGVRVGVAGVLDPPRDGRLGRLLASEGLELTDAKKAAHEAVSALRAEGCEAIVLLAHAPDEAAREIARSEGITIVIESHGNVATRSASLIESDTAFLAPFPGGGAPVKLRLGLVAGARGLADGPELIEGRSWLARLKEQLASQVRERESAPPDRARELDAQIAFVTSKIAATEARLPKEPRNELTVAVHPLDAHRFKTDQDPELGILIDQFKKDVESLALAPAVVSRLEAPAELRPGIPRAFATEATCAACHKKQAAVWPASLHAHAWASLEKTQSQKDPECVRCHSIGFREPGGFAEVRRAVRDGLDFRNVQCEACHGPRQAHPANKDVGLHLPTIETCRKCHDADHDPGFDPKRFDWALARPDKVCVRGLP